MFSIFSSYLVVQKCIPNAWTRVQVLLYFQIHSHTTSDFCYGALGIIWHLTGYFVTKLRLCICDAAPCSNTLFKAVDTNQKIAFVSHKQYIQISLNTWTAYYSCVLVYSKESRWTVSNSFLLLPWLSFQELCQFQL